MTPKTLVVGLLGVTLVACQEAPRESSTGEVDDWFAGVDLPRFLDCARESGSTLLQAHRAGGRPGAAENSIGAIEASLEDGALFIEIDVALTADDTLVLMHDRSVERTSTGSGALGAMSDAQVATLELVDERGRRTGEGVPSLSEALTALAGRGVAQIDLKRPVTFEQIASALEAADAVDRAIVITYSIADAIALHERLPEVMLSVGIDGRGDLAELDAAGVDRDRVTAWLGMGSGRPGLDDRLAAAGIETSFGDFRGERRGSADYVRMAANGAEILSVDNVAAAARALDAESAARALLASCEGARP